MLRLEAGVRVFASTNPFHSNAGIDRLAQLVRDELGEDPLSGDIFCFFNNRRDQVKLLVWDRNGFWLMCKRLERGRFEPIDLHVPSVEIDRVRLAMLLEGLDTKTWKFRKHFSREVRIQPRDDAREESCST